MNCQLCSIPNPTAAWVLKPFRFWRLELSVDQAYLGKMLVILNRHTEDLTETSAEERAELFCVLEEAKASLDMAFRPDTYNYMALGNGTPHLHVHLVPRYARSIMFAGRMFRDLRWGEDYTPHRSYTPSPPMRSAIMDRLARFF